MTRITVQNFSFLSQGLQIAQSTTTTTWLIFNTLDKYKNRNFKSIELSNAVSNRFKTEMSYNVMVFNILIKVIRK